MHYYFTLLLNSSQRINLEIFRSNFPSDLNLKLNYVKVILMRVTQLTETI
jgi:hypothetical protein